MAKAAWDANCCEKGKRESREAASKWRTTRAEVQGGSDAAGGRPGKGKGEKSRKEASLLGEGEDPEGIATTTLLDLLARARHVALGGLCGGRNVDGRRAGAEAL